MIGRTISHYRILAKLGEGGMGVVYRAEDLSLGRQVALKFLSPRLGDDEEARRRFGHEAKAAASLDHPGICVVHEVGEAEDRLFIAMALLDGRTLKERIAAGPLPVGDAIAIAAQIAEALQEAHGRGIVHRDVKPANVMLTPKGVAKVMDFGLARVGGSSLLTQAGSTLGTVAYMSPEQAGGEAVDHRTDIWSLGIVLYEMIAWRRPFQAERDAVLLHLIQHCAPAPLAEARPGVPADLERIVRRCLERDPAQRYQTAADLAADLHRLQGAPLVGGRMEPPIASDASTRPVALEPSGLPPRRAGAARRRAIVGGAGILLLAIVAALLVDRHGGRPAEAAAKSIAVLPFVDLSASRDQDYLCDGITETLIGRLSRLSDLKVPARASVFTFKGKARDIQEIGRQLNVQNLLEGSVQRSGDQLRVTAQLVAVNDGYQFWSRTFDLKSADIFAIQDEIATSVVDALKVRLSAGERQKMAARPIDNVAAYECYLKAYDKIWSFRESALDSANAYLEEGVRIAGDNALLYSALALVCWQYVNIGARQEDTVTRAVDYAEKALALDPEFSLAHLVLGSVYCDFLGNPRESIRHYELALASNPNEPDALRKLAYMCIVTVGRPAAAVPLYERAEQVDPLDPWIHLSVGVRFLYEGKFDSAPEPLREYLQARPDNPAAGFFYAWALALNGRRDEASAIVDASARAAPDNVCAKLGLLMKYSLTRDRENAFRVITPDFQRTCKRDPEWSYYVALMLANLGAKEEAMPWLENAVNRGFVNYPELMRQPWLESLRGDERWSRLMARAKQEWERLRV